MNNYNDATRFLQAVFGTDWETKAFLVNSPNWGKRLRLDQLDDTRDCYWCVGAIPWGKARKNSNVENVRALVIDDVGTKLPKHDIDGLIEVGILPSPLGYVVESSAGNFQYGWYLSDGDVAAYAQLRKMMAEIYDMKDGMAPSHLFRLPIGVNGKPGPNAAFAVRRVAWKT